MRAFILFIFITQAIHSVTIIDDQATLPILTPDLQNRETLKLRLDNGLEAVIVSDPDVDKSGAALSVKVGSLSDPKEHPGLAHFTEHMLFLGTKKYPEEAEYHRFMNQHGGQTNAFTSNESTNYMFSVDNRFFEEALDRFSDFFKEPLFNPSGVSRELQAVDQEYYKNLQDDFIKQYSVHKDLANPNHPFKQFSMGNSDTLSSVTQDQLKTFYNDHYSANLMRLFIISPLPLDTLKELVIQDFSSISNTDKTSFSPSEKAYANEQSMVYIDPIRDIRELAFIWELPKEFSELKETKPDRVLCYILGHEDENSLLAQLKREDLAESLTCGLLRLGVGQTVLYLAADLTEKGLAEKDVVIERIFQALNQLQHTKLPEYLFHDIQRIEQLRYQFQPREEIFGFVMKNISMINEEEISTFPLHSSVVQKFDPKAIQSLIGYLTPQNVRIELVTPLKNIGVTPENTEKWTNTPYTVKPIPQEKISHLASLASHPNINIPEPNPFLPESLEIKSQDKNPAFPKPKQLIQSDKANIYFSEDSSYHVPKVFWYFDLKTPKIDPESATSAVLGDIYVKMLTDTLNHVSYSAHLADLKFKIKRGANGINILIHGYDNKAENLVDEILKHLKLPPLNEDKFKIYKESLQKQYQNFSKESSLTQALELFKDAVQKDYVTEKEKASAIKKITLKKFNAFLKSLYEQAFVEGLLYGNMTEESAKSLSNKVIETLNASKYPIVQQPKTEILVLPNNKGPFYLEKETKAQGNALILAVEGNGYSFKDRAAQQIAMKALHEPFFSNLRTKQQTGYIIQSTDKELEKQLFNLFVIQSSTHDAQDLLARFEQFIEGSVKELEHEVSQDQFEVMRSATLHELKQPPKSLEEMGELLTTLAFKYDGDFDWINKRIEGMEALTYPEFLDLSKQFLSRQNKRRLAILMKGTIPKENLFKFTKLKSIHELKQISNYQGFN